MGAVLLGRLFLWVDDSSMKIRMKKGKEKIPAIGKPMNYRQSWPMLLIGQQGRATGGFGENHPRRAAVFSPKTLPYRKH